MTALRLADAGEAADLAAFLARLIHYDRRAAVRIQAGGGVLAVFGQPAAFEVLAVRTARLAAEPDGPQDATVSAGRLADALDAAAGDTGCPAEGDVADPGPGLAVEVPESVTGPAWAGLLPPRGGWQRLDGIPGTTALRSAVAAAVSEFRERTENVPEERRTRAELDVIGRDIWSRTLGGSELPLRAVHAAHALGFLRPVRQEAPAGRSGGGAAVLEDDAPPVLLASGPWLRLRTPYGSVAVRRPGSGSGLTVSPV
ncbi:hypothetical protein [Streptomyces meridianus]|uniref:FAD-binding PCMH-type domain-containing protein n=1 Tax=Streptomyces meridianus TaxID=2938945 RepID=A0ABT0X075_9ACTN|nr:hypothetical protein [Streptomyces meridianus]MCM2575966.1 hypothetical protein [Streptomyces meridianus]